MVSKRKKYIKQHFLLFLLATGFIRSAYLNRFRIFSLFYIILEILCLLYLCINIRKIQINKIIVVISLFELSIILSTLRAPITNINIFTVVFQGMSSIVFCLYVQFMIRINMKNCVRVLYDLCEILIYINVLSSVFFANGLYNQSDNFDVKHYYFLGHQNQMGYYSLFALTLGTIRKQIDSADEYSGKRLYLLMAISIFYCLRVWSVTSIISVGMMIILLLYNDFSRHGFRLPVIISFLINIVIFILFVVEQNFGFFSFLIQNVFHRNMTLSSRSFIWQSAFNAFLLEPIWGWGSGYGRELFGFQTAHNRYLNILFTQGITGMLIFIVMILLINQRLQNSKSRCVNTFFIYFFCIFIAFQAETFSNTLFFAILILSYNIDKLNFRVNECI